MSAGPLPDWALYIMCVVGGGHLAFSAWALWYLWPPRLQREREQMKERARDKAKADFCRRHHGPGDSA